MITQKGLDFDLIATKPTTVARIEDDPRQTFKHKKTTPNSVDKYLKVHTFSTKHEFLYSLLLEYPQIRSMRLWDDRPCQVAKFRQIGQQWLDNMMLDDFKIIVVQEPQLYLEPQRERDLVLAMVEANNCQVDIEKAGGPFLVAGVGPLPRIRPELKDMNIWGPYETHTPHARFKIEVVQIVRYVGVMFSRTVQRVIRDRIGSRDRTLSKDQWIERPRSLQTENLRKWVVPDDFHVILCLRAAPTEFLETIGGLGTTVLVEVEAVGHREGRIWALKVKEMKPQEPDQDQRALYIVAPNGEVYSSLEALKSAYASNRPSSSLSDTTEISYDHVDLDHLGNMSLMRDQTPHITMAYDRLNGARALDYNLIQEWEPLMTPQGTPFPGRLILVGKIGEKRLLGMKTNTSASQQPIKAEVSLGNIIKKLLSDKDIPGKELGKMVKAVKDEMERLSVENRLANEERIATIAQEICDRAETMKMCASA
ncbi:hypothetical protein BGZ65_002222 [Modicella reniformis]|uniref:Swiss Army Knife RNA repair protein HAD domain-containing protein n=1 Tax=Modicella reniformis TaxID=1440133 RepID=A0A9P6J1I4_9FUNG|nr:hypothetical protein BGZ65_002222 [Modicella reniformis]